MEKDDYEERAEIEHGKLTENDLNKYESFAVPTSGRPRPLKKLKLW